MTAALCNAIHKFKCYEEKKVGAPRIKWFVGETRLTNEVCWKWKYRWNLIVLFSG